MKIMNAYRRTSLTKPSSGYRNSTAFAAESGSTEQPASVLRIRQLVRWLNLSLTDLNEYCNRAVPIGSLFRILSGRQQPTTFERKALAHALCKAVQERAEILFEG